jgi:hypothetical protein
MRVYEISYDLNRPGQNYQSLYDAIKSLGTWWHCLDSTWLVACDSSAKKIRDRLAQHLDGNDCLLVTRLSGEAAWTGFKQECSSWLLEKLNAATTV